MSPLTTACEPSTHPRPTVVLRKTVTLVAIQVSGPIRTGPFRMPWFLDRHVDVVHLVVESRTRRPSPPSAPSHPVSMSR